MASLNCKVTVKDGNKKLVTEYEPMGSITLDVEDKNIRRMIDETLEQFKMNPDVEAPSIVIKITMVIQ